MTLDIFTQKLGDLSKPRFALDASDEALGETASKMLEAVQMVVDVMSDPKTGRPYRVSFAPGPSAYTSGGERRIVISGEPLVSAKTGTALADIAAIETGFAIHEVGHANRDGKLFAAVKQRWPGKGVPQRIANVLEDVALEAATIQRYAGFADVFTPTLRWVAEKTCPTFPIPWGTTTGARVNCMGQVVRYRDFVRFAADPQTAKAVEFFDDWRDAITGDMKVPAMVEHIAKALAFIHDHSDDPEPEGQPDEPEGDEGDEGEGKDGGKGKAKPKDDTEGETTDETIPEDEDDDTEGDSDGDGDGSDGDGTEGDEADGTDGDGDADTEGEGDGDGDGEGGGGTGTGTPGGRGDTIDTTDRVDADKGSNDSDGAGGTGQAIAEAGDPDEGYEPTTKTESFDSAIGHEDLDLYGGRVLDKAVETERSTLRLNAREHGTMRVIFRG